MEIAQLHLSQDVRCPLFSLGVETVQLTQLTLLKETIREMTRRFYPMKENWKNAALDHAREIHGFKDYGVGQGQTLDRKVIIIVRLVSF